jgi:hypothetical protein
MICSALKISYIRDGVLCHAKIGWKREQGTREQKNKGDLGTGNKGGFFGNKGEKNKEQGILNSEF